MIRCKDELVPRIFLSQIQKCAYSSDTGDYSISMFRTAGATRNSAKAEGFEPSDEQSDGSGRLDILWCWDTC